MLGLKCEIQYLDSIGHTAAQKHGGNVGKVACFLGIVWWWCILERWCVVSWPIFQRSRGSSFLKTNLKKKKGDIRKPFCLARNMDFAQRLHLDVAGAGWGWEHLKIDQLWTYINLISKKSKLSPTSNFQIVAPLQETTLISCSSKHTDGYLWKHGKELSFQKFQTIMKTHF